MGIGLIPKLKKNQAIKNGKMLYWDFVRWIDTGNIYLAKFSNLLFLLKKTPQMLKWNNFMKINTWNDS